MKNVFLRRWASPGASGERHAIYKILQPSFGLTYNMLKNSKSVTLFIIFYKKKSPRLSPGQFVKENYNNRRVVSRKEYVFFYLFPPTYNMQETCPHKPAPRGQVTKKGKEENLASICPGR